MRTPKQRHGVKPESYFIAALWQPGADDFDILTDRERRVIIFDTFNQCQAFVPQLGFGRIPKWTTSGEMVVWPNRGVAGEANKAQIMNYDVYNVPNGVGVKSEMRNMDWVNHVHFAEWWINEGQWAVTHSQKLKKVA